MQYQGGYVEEKMIRGYGPYLYLRYWEGRRLRSEYLGRAGSARCIAALATVRVYRTGPKKKKEVECEAGGVS